ncbi:MAG: MBL fold metallo-hydrolase, partial [Phreatobacter sp.]|nr:MBL fold metallo-hydrolase [Phreatobacter sp.]
MTTINRRHAMAAGAAALAAPAFLTASNAPVFAQAAAAAAQAPGFYKYKVGDITVTAINDGFFNRPLEGFIRNAELPAVQAAMSAA